jgi:hypothetical protein
MKNLDLDKALTRIKKSAKAHQKLVEADTKKKLGASAYKAMKKEEELKAAESRENQSKNEVIRTLNEQIMKTKEGSKEEADLIKRRNRISKSMGRW